MEAGRVQGSSDKMVQTTTGYGVGYLHSHPCPILASVEGKTGKKRSPCNLGMLSNTISKADGRSPHKGGTLFGATKKVGIAKDEVVYLIASKARVSAEGM